MKVDDLFVSLCGSERGRPAGPAVLRGRGETSGSETSDAVVPRNFSSESPPASLWAGSLGAPSLPARPLPTLGRGSSKQDLSHLWTKSPIGLGY